ncbi:MAG: DUF3098 domain-containing protein [Bacteroidota bacterium]
MSKGKTTKKKVIANKKVVGKSGSTKKKLAPTTSRATRSDTGSTQREDFVFGKQNYILMAAGAALILLGLITMIGGSMPDPDTWDPNIIYSTRITVLAPFLMLAGFGLEVYAIFKK